jgi:hypothetical protein
MTVLFWLAIGVLLISLVGMLAFTSLPAARKLKRECWHILPADWKAALALWLLLGLIGDFVFNYTRAVVIFRELKGDILFSNRIQRHVNEHRWDALTRKWVTLLNTVDDQHIKLPADWVP